MCVCMCVDRLHDLSGETESVYANAVKQPVTQGEGVSCG